MKYVLSVILLFTLGITVFGRRIAWQPKEKPSVSLVAAVELATKELNKDGADFYCLGASIAKTFSSCDWELYFSNAKGESRVLSLDSDLKIRVREGGFEY